MFRSQASSKIASASPSKTANTADASTTKFIFSTFADPPQNLFACNFSSVFSHKFSPPVLHTFKNSSTLYFFYLPMDSQLLSHRQPHQLPYGHRFLTRYLLQ